MKAYKLYKQLVVGHDSDGYERHTDKVLGYYLNRETAESHKELYLKWNSIKNDDVFIY